MGQSPSNNIRYRSTSCLNVLSVHIISFLSVIHRYPALRMKSMSLKTGVNGSSRCIVLSTFAHFLILSAGFLKNKHDFGLRAQSLRVENDNVLI